MFHLDPGYVRLSEVAAVRIERGHSFSKMIVTMKSGQTLDVNGSLLWEKERALLAAIEEQAAPRVTQRVQGGD